MAAEIGRRPLPAVAPRVPLLRRLYGLGSVFGKTSGTRASAWSRSPRCSAGSSSAGGATMASTYGTLETRRELATLSSTLPPVLRGLYGDPVNVDTLGGFISWHYGAYFALLAGLWSILALSSTLAGEARRGSLEFALVTPLSRRVVAVEKVAGHVVALVVAMAFVALDDLGHRRRVREAARRCDRGRRRPSGSRSASARRRSSPDRSPSRSRRFVGRGAAAGLAGALMVAGYVLNSYRALVPAFDSAANLTWFSWTRDHLPLAGQTDWAGVALVLVVARRPARDRRRGLRATRRRRDRRRSGRPASRGRCSASAGRSVDRSASCCRQPGLGDRARAVRLRHGRLEPGLHGGARELARPRRGGPQHAPRGRPDDDGRVPPDGVRRLRAGARRARRGDLRRRAVVGRDERPARAAPDDAAVPCPLGDRERDGGLGGDRGDDRPARGVDRRRRRRSPAAMRSSRWSVRSHSRSTGWRWPGSAWPSAA